MPDLARTYGESLARLVQVPTVTGSDRQNFVNFRKVLAEEFPAVYRACDVIRPGGEDSDALIFKWKSKSSRRPLVLMAHQDVVPAEGDWKYPPYSGTIADGKVWGRGAMDCKNTLFATMRSVNELIEEGFVPEQDVYLCYSDSEETSGPGARYCRDWLKSAGVTPAVAIDEGGAIVEQAFPGMTKPFAMVGFIEKGYCDVKFVARSKGGHSSSPPKHTPFARLAAFMHYCETHTVFKRRLSEPAREMLVGLSDGLSGALKFVTKHAGFFAPLITAVLPRLTPFGAALTGTTMTFTMAQGSGAPNVIPQEAYVVANLRFAPGDKSTDCVAKLRAIAARYDLETVVMECREHSPEVDTKSADFCYFTDTVRKVFPDIGVSPYLLFGGTDCRTMQTITPCAIRCTPCKLSPEQLASMHAADENVDMSALVGAVQFFKTYIKGYK